MKIVQALATLFGTIVGAGVFALPYAASRSGFVVAIFWLALLAAVMALLHLMLGEVALRTPLRHRLPGYARLYLGPRASKVAWVSDLVGLSGALLAYLVLGSIFLANIFGTPTPLLWGVLFWAGLTVPVLLGLRTIAGLELVMSGLLALLFAGLAVFLFSSFSGERLFIASATRPFDLFLPYGVTLFALFGTNAVYEVRDMLQGREQRMRRVVILGTILPAALYVVFIAAVLGATGGQVSEDAISGLGGLFGYPVVALGSFIGLLAVASSYLVIGRYVLDELQLDMRLGHFLPYAVLALPLILFAAGARNFLAIVGTVGAVTAALAGSLIIAVWLAARRKGERKPEYRVPVPKYLALGIVVMFVVAAVIEIFTLL